MLYQQFLHTVDTYPTINALYSEGHYYSYEALNNIVQQFSHFLENEQRHCFLIYCSKSVHNIAWQLACNKTQNIFMNADINTPLDRIEYMLSITNPKWILTDQEVDLSQFNYQLLTNIENKSLWFIPNHFDTKYNKDITHIYFSSGSTGKPKAILLNDKAIIEVVMQQSKMIELSINSRFAWLLSPSFDASLSDIYTTLLTGACLYICPFKMSQLKTLYTFFNAHAITHTDLSPSILSLLTPHLLPNLVGVIFGGEVAQEDTIKKWVGANINMFNAYGPTETTICSSLKKVDMAWTANNVGQPLNGVNYHLQLNNNQQYELHISGQHLAIGYDQKQLNDQKFYIKDDKRYYITGDLFSQNSEGDYLFMGRSDRQFKYNGVLISPEEIEHYCMQAGCREALCKLEDKLTLYFSGMTDIHLLKQFVSKKIPSNMLPQRWILLDSLTKNINGKVQL